jgi:excisionase family DNA binding protein
MSPAEQALRRALSPELVDALVQLIDERVTATSTRPSTLSRWFTVEQAAAYLGVSAKAVRGRIGRGRLPVVRDGRRVYVDRQALDETFAAKGCILGKLIKAPGVRKHRGARPQGGTSP